MIISGYSLPLVESKLYREQWPNRDPYPHQAKVLQEWNNDHKAFFVNTSTGSGKTITAALPIVVNGESAIFLYPTNALLEDQVRSIGKMVEDCNRKVYIFDGNLEWNSLLFEKADIFLVVVNGESLERMRRLFRSSSKGDVFSHILSLDKPTLLITNPDSLFLLATAKYRNSFKALSFLRSCSTLVVDEFHLYSGLELSNLLFLLFYLRELRIFERLVFLSATPSKCALQLINQIFSPLHVTASADGYVVTGTRQSVHNLDCNLITITDRKELTDAIAEEIQKKLPDILNTPPASSSTPVPVVIIVDSVIQAIILEDKLRQIGIPVDRIASYRGLFNPIFRKVDGALIIVGTRAIEVGVDFDCRWLLFEASEAGSFLQRLGRAGRHAPGHVTLFARPSVIDSMGELDDPIDRIQLEDWVRTTYPYHDDMSWFLGTEVGLRSAFTVVNAGIKKVAEDWTLTQDELNPAVLALQDIFNRYLDELGQHVGSTIKKKIQCIPLKSDHWSYAYGKTVSFRTSSFTIKEVVHYHEIRMERDLEAGCFSAPFKKVLEQGRGLRRLDSREGLRISVQSFGKTYPAKVALVPQLGCDDYKLHVLDSECTFIGTEISQNKDDITSEPIIYVRIPRDEIPSIDWRIEIWEDAFNPSMIVAFGGHALLLRAFYEERHGKKG